METTYPICEFVCRICGNPENNKIYKVREMMFGTREEFDYAECSECKCLQLITIPPDMSEYYPMDYYSFKKKFETGPGKRKIFKGYLQQKKKLYHITRRSLVGLIANKIYPITNPHPLIARIGIRKSASILDIGCGNGELLYDLRNIGFKHTVGVDPYIEEEIQYNNRLKILKKSVSDIDGKYDLIMLHHSFEHMDEPLKILQAIHRLLKPDGTCMIRIPTVSSYAWDHYRENWNQIDAPRHFFLHSLKSMELLSVNAGLYIENVIYDSNAFQFWGSEQNLKDIHMHAENSAKINIDRSIFTKKDMLSFRSRAIELNRNNLGDQAAFFLKRTSAL